MDELTALARAAGRGDRGALARLVEQTQADMWRLCARLVDPAAADDLVQESYLRAIRSLGTFRGDAPARVWLLAIARRACAAQIAERARDRRLAGRLAALPEAARQLPAPEPHAQVVVDDLIAALGPERRAAFVLTQLLGCSYAEAAAICGCPVGTIRSRVARAREDLDVMISQSGPARPPAACAGD